MMSDRYQKFTSYRSTYVLSMYHPILMELIEFPRYVDIFQKIVNDFTLVFDPNEKCVLIQKLFLHDA